MANYISLLGKAYDAGKKAYATVSASVATMSAARPPYEVVEIEGRDLHNNYTPQSPNTPSPFSIYAHNTPPNSLVVIYSLPGSGRYLGVYRAPANQVQDVINTVSRLEEQSFLFNSVGLDKDSIQGLVEVIHRHPFWNTIHYASHLNLSSYFSAVSGDPYVKGSVYIPCEPENYFPLHIACQSGSVESAKALIALGADVTKTDPNGLNALHFTVQNTKADIVEYLSGVKGFLECAEMRTGSGYTPLFLAIQYKNSAAVEALLRYGVNPEDACGGKTPFQVALDLVDDDKAFSCLKVIAQKSPKSLVQQDTTTGNTVLHRKLQNNELAGLLESCIGLNLDVQNNLGKIPLHTSVACGNLDASILLLAHGANANLPDFDGNTALHLALTGIHKDVAKAVIVFGGDPCLKNKKGVSSLDLALKIDKTLALEMRTIAFGAQDNKAVGSSEVHKDTIDNFAQVVALTAAATRKKDSGKKVLNLLSLDGGGIRGLILIQILSVLEKRLGHSIFSHFQWVGGTSTGAILAVALAMGRSLKECQRIYFRFKDIVFCGNRPYDSVALETFLKQEIGEATTIHNITDTRLMLTAVKANTHPVELVVFRNYSTVLSPAENVQLGFQNPIEELWKCVRCSSAAPTYFYSVDGTYVDGGLIANNPTLDLLSEVHVCNTAAKYAGKGEDVLEVGCVLSVGTGRIPDRAIPNLDIAGLKSSGIFEAISTAFAARDLGTVLIDQVTATEGRPVDRSRSWCHSMGIPFFRFSTYLSKDIPLDTTDNLTLINMLWETELYMATNTHITHSLIDYLNI